MSVVSYTSNGPDEKENLGKFEFKFLGRMDRSGSGLPDKYEV